MSESARSIEGAIAGAVEPPARALEAVERTEALARGGRGALSATLEFLVVGGATLLLLPLCWGYRRAFGLDEGELVMGALAFHAASWINDPHFASTYLLFYRGARARACDRARSRRERLRYWMAAAVAPLALSAWAAYAIAGRSAPALGGLIQLMFVLVGWHYVKQGFGVMMLLSARQGVLWSRGERRVLLAHCFAGWAYAWASPFDPGTRSVVNGVFYTTLPHPPGLELATRLAFFASALAVLPMLARKWRREGRSPPLAPVVGLLISVWLWTVYTRLDPLLMYWIPALHSLQYLYFVALHERSVALEAAGPPSFKGNIGQALAIFAAGAVALGWLGLRGVPAWLDATQVLPASTPALAALGPTPYLAAFTAVVNIHHYLMDSVIWRREYGVTRRLLPQAAAG